MPSLPGCLPRHADPKRRLLTRPRRHTARLRRRRIHPLRPSVSPFFSVEAVHGDYPCQIKGHGHTLKADGIHGEIQHIRRNYNIFSCPAIILYTSCLEAPHCPQLPGGLQTATFIHIHGHGHLKKVNSQKGFPPPDRFPDVNGNFKRAVLSGQLIGVHFRPPSR